MLKIEIAKVSNYAESIIERIQKRKNLIIEEIRNAINYRNQKFKEKYSSIISQIEHVKEGWNSLNNFSNQMNKLSYEDFINIRKVNVQELHNTGIIIES